MIVEFKAPRPLTTVFLAGSIEMGAAQDWQVYVMETLRRINTLSGYDDFSIICYNPRRTDWDSSWEQSIHNQQFRQQVEWEHKYLNLAEYVFFNFVENTKSPITLMELGMVVGKKDPSKIVVVCPNGFWRKGNVDILCENNGVSVLNNLNLGIDRLLSRILKEMVKA